MGKGSCHGNNLERGGGPRCHGNVLEKRGGGSVMGTFLRGGGVGRDILGSVSCGEARGGGGGLAFLPRELGVGQRQLGPMEHFSTGTFWMGGGRGNVATGRFWRERMLKAWLAKCC